MTTAMRWSRLRKRRRASRSILRGGGTITTSNGGTVDLNADGTFTYTAPDGFVGGDTFSYAAYDGIQDQASLDWVEVRIDVWNRLSLPAGDTFYFTHQYTPAGDDLEGNVSANDVEALDSTVGSDYNEPKLVDPTTGQAVAAGTKVATAKGGEVELDADGKFIYTPKADWSAGSTTRTPGGFTGTDSFSYVIEDEVEKTTPVTVQLVVNNQAPQAVDDVFMIKQSLDAAGDVMVVNGQVLSNDWDAEGDDLVLDLSHYGIALQSEQVMVFNPDTEQYEPLTVTDPVTGDEVPVMEDFVVIPTVMGGQAKLKADGSFGYTGPDKTKGFDGVDSFDYRLLDGASHSLRSNVGSITGTVRIYAVNNIIQATDDFHIVQMGDFAGMDGLALITNDYLGDANASDFEIEVIAGSLEVKNGHGEVAIDGHTFKYTPKKTADAGSPADPFQHGEVSFRYRLTQKAVLPSPSDPMQSLELVVARSEATVTLVIQPPLYRAADDYMPVGKNGVGGNLLENDYQDTPANTAIKQTIKTGTFDTEQGGSVTIFSNGAFTYIPPSTDYGIFNGMDSFKYTAGWGDPTDSSVELVGESTAEVVIAYQGASYTGTLDSDTSKSTGKTFVAGGSDQAFNINDDLLRLFYSQDTINDELNIASFAVKHGPWLASTDEHGPELHIEDIGYSLPLTGTVTDALTFTVANNDGVFSDFTVTWQVSPPEPVVTNDVAYTQPETKVVIDVLANDGIKTQHGDFDTELPVSLVSQLQVTNPGDLNGTAVFVNNKLEYTPNAGMTGPETIQYAVTVGVASYTGEATVHVALQEPPVLQAADDMLPTVVLGTGSTGTQSFDLLDNDTVQDSQGTTIDPARIYVANQGQHGYARISSTGRLYYDVHQRPGTNDVTDTITYAIEDKWGNVSTASVTVQVTTDPVEPATTSPQTYSYTPSSTNSVTLTSGQDWTWRSGDHQIYVDASSGGATISFANNSAVVTSADAGTRLKVIRSGDPAGKLSVGWAGAGAGNTLEVTNNGQVAGMTFAGELVVSASGDIDENFTAKSLELRANNGASISGTHRATGTSTDDDLKIENAHDVSGILTADTGSVEVWAGHSNLAISGDVDAAITAGEDIKIRVNDGINQKVKGTLNATGAVEVRGETLIDAQVTYGTSLNLRADHGEIRGTYTNSDQVNGGFATVTAVNIDATFNNVSQDSTFKADHDLAGTIRGDQAYEVISEYGSISATLEIGNLDYLTAGRDFTGKATGSGTLGRIWIGRDLGGEIAYHTIESVYHYDNRAGVGRDFIGNITTGAGGFGAGTFKVGRNFAGTVVSEGAMDMDIEAGLDLNGSVTALNAVDAINLSARRSIGVKLNMPKAYLWNVTAGDYEYDSDLEARGSIKGANITAAGIGDIEVYGGWGITGDDAGRIIDTEITLHADQLEAVHADHVGGAGGWALNNVMATGAVQGLSINVQRQSAADNAIGLIETGSRSGAASSLSVVTQGAVGTIHAKQGDLTLTKLDAGSVNLIHAEQGSLALTDSTIKQGINGLTVRGDLAGKLTVEQGNLGTYNPSAPYDPSIEIGGGIDAALSATQGDIGLIVAGLVTAGDIKQSIKAEQGTVRGVENRGGIGSPFSTYTNDINHLGKPLTAAHEVTRGKALDLPDWYISTSVGNPIASLFFTEPNMLYKPGYAAAGHISADISARTIGSVHAMGDLSGKITADQSIDGLWVFGDITDDSTITSEAGSVTASVWGDAKASEITAKHNAVLNVHGDLESIVKAELGGVTANVWGEIGGGAQLHAKGNINTWSRGVNIAHTIDSEEGDLYIDSWSDIQIENLDGEQGRLRAYGNIDGKKKAGSKIKITSSSLGNQSWDYNGAMSEHVVVSRGNYSGKGSNYSLEDLFYAVVGGNMEFENPLVLTKETASATLLVKGEFKGKVSIRQSNGYQTNPDLLRGYLKADVGSIAAGSELAAKTMVLAVNGDVNANTDANTKFYAADYLGLDAQGIVKGSYTAGKGQVQILAGEDFDATAKGQLGAVVNARGSVTGQIISDGGAVFVASFNSPDGTTAGVDATIFANSQASVQSFGTTKIKQVNTGPDGRITNGGLEVFSVGDILSGTRLTAGGDVGVESWGSIDAFIEASAYDPFATPDPDEQPTEYAASVTAHGDLTGAIYAGGDIQAVALNNLNALMQSDLGSISAQAGGTLQNTFRAATNIDLIANTIENALIESTNGQASAIALGNATLSEVTAKGDVQLIAGNNLTVSNTIKAAGETDAQGEPTLTPAVTLIADQGALAATVAAGHGNVSAYAGQTADLTTQADGTIGTPLTVSVIAQGDITGSLVAQDSITAMALDAVDPTASPAETHSPASINLTGVTASADGSSVYLFADGGIGGASFSATANKTLVASANDAVQGAFTAGAGGVSISSLTSIDANATTNPGTGGDISLFTGGVAHGQDTDLSTYTIAGTVSADGDAELFAAGKITAPVTAGGSASVSALGGDITGSITANGTDGTLSVFSGVAEVPEKEVDGNPVPAHDEGGSVTGTITAGGALSVLAAGDLTGTATVDGDAELLILGELQAGVTSHTGDLALYAGAVAGNITATAGSANITSGSDITGDLTAATGLTALAGNDIDGDLSVTGTGDAEVIALGQIEGTVTTADGDLSAVVGEGFNATLTAGHITRGGGVDALAMASFEGAIHADAAANVTVLGNAAGTIHAAKSAAAAALDNNNIPSTVTVLGDGSADGTNAGHVTGDITAGFGSITLTASGDLAAAVNAGNAPAATAGSADVTLSGGITDTGSITAHTDAAVLAFKAIAGTVTATNGDASVTTADALSSATVTAGTDAGVSAIKESNVTVDAGNDIRLSLSAASNDRHTVALTAASDIRANLIADVTGDLDAGGNADVFVLGAVTGSPAYAAGGTLEVLASGGMTLGAVSGDQGVDLSTPAALQAASIASSAGSVELFVGGALSLAGGSVTAHEDLSVSTKGVITAGSLRATNGDLAVATQADFSVDADAGGGLSIAALGSIFSATYTAGGDLTLISLDRIINTAGSVDAGGAVRLLARGDVYTDDLRAGAVSLLHTEGDLFGIINAANGIERLIVHGEMNATLIANGAGYTYDEPGQPGVEPFIWSVKGEAYSLDRVRADLMSLDEGLLSLAERIGGALIGTNAQQGATAADLTKAEADLNKALGAAHASAGEAFVSIEKGVDGAVADTNATFARASKGTAVSLSRGVTDSQALLADLTMQVSEQAVRSYETLLQATSGLTDAVTQLGDARVENERLFGLYNSAVSNSLDRGKEFRDDNFDHAAQAAIESIKEIEREEALDNLQFVIAILGMAPGPIGIGFDLLNAGISLARGNVDAAREHLVYAIPYVGTVYGLGQLGVMLGQYTVSKLGSAVSAQPGEQTPTELPVVHRVNWVSGPGGGNSFVAGTGVVTGVDEHGNLITTAIEDLQVGDVVLAGNELDPTDPTSYELVTATSHRTVHELTEVTYVDEDGNVEVIKATDNHEFYVEGAGWVKAEQLQQGVFLRLADGRTATVTSTTTLAVPEGVEVYNLSVTDGKTYFVDDGQGNVAAAWVHNRTGQKLFREKLGLKKGDPRQAGHVVPVAFFVTRSVQTIRAVVQSKIVLARAKIPLNHRVNGFKAKAGGHNGTHTDAFFQNMGPRLKNAYDRAVKQGKSLKEIQKDVVRELRQIKKEIRNGDFL
ncbi:MAG: polymorphic toxin-type HINT domain-containing protein [Planctomycetota bacterium]